MKFVRLHGSHSQSGQESFVLGILDNLENGFFLEIGAFHSKELSNTFLLERRFGWRGVAIEIDKRRSKQYNRNRENPCITADATNLNYEKLFFDYNAPQIIDYLQIDIEPASNSLRALTSLPFFTTKFRTITFEHDVYSDIKISKSKKRLFYFCRATGTVAWLRMSKIQDCATRIGTFSLN